MKYCQGPLCHTYDTKDRKRGPKGNKTNQTRRRSKMYYGERAVDYFGRITQPIVLTENNAWEKRYRWAYENPADRYYMYNVCTGEQRPLTDEQFNDDNYTLNT